MSSVLALRTKPSHRETLHSFVGGLASINGVSLRDYLQDFDLSINKLMALNPDVFAAVAQLADLDDAELFELTSWMGVPQAGVRMAYRGEEIVSRAIRNPEVRCWRCALCDATGQS